MEAKNWKEMWPRVTARCLQPHFLTTCPLHYPKPPAKVLGQGLVPMEWWGQVTFPAAALWAAYADQGLTPPFASVALGHSPRQLPWKGAGSKMELSQAQIQPLRARAQERSWDAVPWDGLPSLEQGCQEAGGCRAPGKGNASHQNQQPSTAFQHLRFSTSGTGSRRKPLPPS